MFIIYHSTFQYSIMSSNVIDFAAPAQRRLTVRKCSKCKQPGHTKPNCLRCDYCTENHTVDECRNPVYLKIFDRLILVASYSHAYHCSPRFINEYSNSHGELSSVPRSEIPGHRYQKTIEQFICDKLKLEYITGSAVPHRRSIAIYDTVSRLSRETTLQCFTPEKYAIINECLAEFYRVKIVIVDSESTISYVQAPYEPTAEANLVRPNTEHEIQIRRDTRNADMFAFTQRLVHTVRHDIRVTAGVTYEVQYRADSLTTLNGRRQSLVSRIERLQAQLTDMDSSVARHTIAQTNWDERRQESAQTEIRNRQRLTIAQNDLRNFQIQSGVPVNVPPLHLQRPAMTAERKLYPNITTCYISTAQQTAVLSCPICWDEDVPSEQFATPTCAHPVCATCLTNYMTSLPPRQVPCCSMCRAPFSRLTFNSAQLSSNFIDKFKTSAPI